MAKAATTASAADAMTGPTRAGGVRGGIPRPRRPQLLAEAEQQEQEVVDADADEHDGDQLRRAGVEREPERAARRADQAAGGAADDDGREQREHGGQDAAEEQRAQQDRGAEQQQLSELPARPSVSLKSVGRPTRSRP